MIVQFPVVLGGDGSSVADNGSSIGLLADGHSERLLPAMTNIVSIAQEVDNRKKANAATQYAHFQEQIAYNVAGSGATGSPQYVDRATLNTTVKNSITGASLVSGKVRLASIGTYKIKVRGVAYYNSRLQILITNTTGGATTTTIEGVNSNAMSVFAAVAAGKFTINQSSDIVVRHWSGTSGVSGVYGYPHQNASIPNVYLEIELIKLY